MWAITSTTNSYTSDIDVRHRDTSAYQIMAFAGVGVLIASIIGLTVAPNTHVDADNGERLDANADPARRSGTRLTAAGLTF